MDVNELEKVIRLVGGWVAKVGHGCCRERLWWPPGRSSGSKLPCPFPMRPHSRWQFGLWTLEAVALRVKIEKPGHLVSFTLHFLWVYRSLASKSLEIFSREGFIDIRRGTYYHYMGDENYILTFAASELLLFQGVKAPSHPLIYLKRLHKRSEEGKALAFYITEK